MEIKGDFVKDWVLDSVLVNNNKISSSHRKKMLRAKLKMTLVNLHIFIKDIPVLDSAGRILVMKQKCSSDFYDLVVDFDFAVNLLVEQKSMYIIENAVRRLEVSLTDFCSKYSELEYNSLMQEFLLSIGSTEDNSELLFTFYMYLHPLIVEWYCRGMQSSGNSKIRVSLCGSMDITLLEMDIISFSVTQLIKKIDYISDKEVKAIISGFKILNGEAKYLALQKAVEAQDDEDLLSKLKVGSYSASLYSIFDNEPSPNYCLQFIFHDRKDKGESNMVALLSELFDSFTPDFLKQRKIFVREKGVIIRLKKSCSGINSFFVKEIHEDNHHLILLQTRYGALDAKKNLIIDIEHSNFMMNELFLRSDSIAVIWLICWLGLRDVLLACDWFKNCEDFASANNIKLLFEFVAQYAEEGNLYYEEPPSWNYEGHSVGAKKLVSTPKIQKQIQVGNYLRKLPNGAKASPEAVAAANHYCLDLEDGYTFVNSFTRMQIVRV